MIESLDFSTIRVMYRMNSKLDCCSSIIKEISISFLRSNRIIFYDIFPFVIQFWSEVFIRRSWFFWAFNDFVEWFFFQTGIIVQHTSLKSNNNKKPIIRSQVWIYFVFSLFHTRSKGYIQVQIHTLTSFNTWCWRLYGVF